MLEHVNFPSIFSNIPAPPLYRVYTCKSQLVRFFRVCISFLTFLYRGFLLARVPSSKNVISPKIRLSPSIVTWLFVSQKTMVMFRLSWSSQSCSYFLVHDVTRLCTWVTRRVPLMGQKLLTLPNHLHSLPFFSGIYIAQTFFSM